MLNGLTACEALVILAANARYLAEIVECPEMAQRLSTWSCEAQWAAGESLAPEEPPGRHLRAVA